MDLFAGKIRKNLQHNARRQALLYLYLLRDFSRALMASLSGSITSCRRVMSQRDRTCRERDREPVNLSRHLWLRSEQDLFNGRLRNSRSIEWWVRML